MTKPGPYTIERPSEETDCEYCGYPLYVGDRAYQTDDYAHTYCCRTCAAKAERPRWTAQATVRVHV